MKTVDTRSVLENFSAEELDRFRIEDEVFITEAKAFVSKFNAQRATFFGYPGNLSQDSATVDTLRALETQLYYVNNAGDPFEQGDNHFDGKAYERKLLSLLFKRYQMDPEKSWGYITSGGSESNIWGIQAGFLKYPQGHLYFSSAAHYSVLKAVSLQDRSLYPHTVIPVESAHHEAINIDILLETLQSNYALGQIPILLLTWGTTKLGSLDDVKTITQKLTSLHIPYYCHVDAAFYGGIPANQIDAPVIQSLEELGADSLSISFHKYFGVPSINSVVLSRHFQSGTYVSYLGHHDTTVLGSRSFSIFSATQRIKEVLERSPKDAYVRNIKLTQALLNQHQIPYHRDGLSNIFVINKPHSSTLQKYHLASFEGKSGHISLTHFIVNPFHTEEEILALILDLNLEAPTPLDL